MAPLDSDPDWPDQSLPQAVSGEWALDDAPAAGGPRYKRGSVLGEGGMGTVYLADDVRLRRKVALKQARGEPSGAAARQLRHEARITAALDHPGVVSVYDLGTDPDGRPWYTMRVVRGHSLRQALVGAADLPARLRLLRPLLGACEAVAHAHQRGVVHRDLKPDNVMLGPLGEVQVMDWGLAALVEGASTGWDAVLSRVVTPPPANAVGTPAYMSPEQAGGAPPTATDDVWALGVCLYEVVGGARAFQDANPQRILALVRAAGPLDPREAAPAAAPELAAIVGRATAPSAADRYPDAAALAADLKAWLDGRRVSAHHYTAGDELTRTLARSRRTLRAVGLVSLVALLVVGVAWSRTLAERDRALGAQEALERSQAQANAHLADALVAQARAAARVGARGEAETLAAHALRLRENPEARGLLMDAGARPRLLSDLALPGDCIDRVLRPDGGVVACRGAERLSLYDVADGARIWEVVTALGEVAFSPDGHLFGRIAGDTHVRFLHRDSGGPLRDGPSLRTLTDQPGPSLQRGQVLYRNTVFAEVIDLKSGKVRKRVGAPPLEAALVLPGGALLAVEDGVLVREGTPDQRSPLAARARGPAARALVMAADAGATHTILGFLDGWVEVHTLAPTARRDTVPLGEGAVTGVALGPDAVWAAAIDERGGAWIWPVGEPQARQRLPGVARQVTFSDPQTLVVLGAQLRRWALPPATALGQLAGPMGVTSLDWAGDTLAVSLAEGAVRAWTGAGQLAASWRWFDRIVTKDVALSADGQRLVAAALSVNAWGAALTDPTGQVQPGFGSGCRRVVWLEPDLLVCAPFHDGPQVGRLGGEMYPALGRPGLVVFDIEPSADRRRAALTADSGDVLLLEAGPSPSLRSLFTDPEVRAVAITNDGTRVVTALSSGVQMRDAAGAALWQQPTATGLRDVAVSPGDRLVAGGERDGRTRLWRASDGTPLAVLGGHDERVQAVVFSPDGRHLATGSWDDTVRLWDLTVLDRSPAALLAEVEATWGLDLAAALAADAGL